MSSGLITVWNAETGDRLHAFSGHSGSVTGLAFRDGLLFSTAADGSLRFWSLAEGRAVARGDHPNVVQVGGPYAARDGATVYTTHYQIKQWELAD